MRNKLNNVRAYCIRPLFTATLGFALSFTLSCTTGDGGGNTLYYCQLSSGGCIQTATVSDCSQAGGSITDVCQDRNNSPGNSVSYGGKTYKTVKIGTQTWLAENLNYDVAGSSKCYGNDLANCAKYGMLYDWATAMALPSSCNSASCASQIYVKHQGICPSGWHLPSQLEWDALTSYIQGDKGCTSCDARYLKVTNGWNSNGNGWDSYGFSALPGGYYDYNSGYFRYAGDIGIWWKFYESADLIII